ncbi:hypothetical protein QTP70_032526, partial [Hemibagrus guttatus]
HVDFATKGVNALDLVYTNIPGAYHVEPRTHLGYSDHISVMVIPACRLLVRRSKPVLKEVKTWLEGAISALQDCFECTDWNMFREAATNGDTTDLEEYMSSVISYISKCIDDVTISKSITTGSNQKSWMTAKGAGGNWTTVGGRSRGGRRVRRQREKRKGKSVGLRIGTLNVGTMTGKGRELADMMERRKVDILCVQKTRWKGSKARSTGAGFKLFYYGVDSKRNGVGVVLKEEFVRNVLEVKSLSDRVMSLKLEIEGVMLNVVSGYAPQVGCELEEKERFWSELDEVRESIPTGERVVIGADFNGHVGKGNRGDEEVMGRFGVKERNLEGQMVVDFAKRMDMAVANTYFQKREEHRVTYKMWKGLKDITNYKTPSPSTEANQQLAEDLNEFYCRFETAGLTPHAPSKHLSTQPLTPPATPLYPPPALQISEDDVRQIFLKQKKRKAPGPDGVTPACLKTCADQLAFIFSQIFNRSLELCEVPVCFKRSTIIPIPKKPKITGLNDYRPVALTSVVMKLFERLVLAYLKNITGPLLDPLQFAYRANRSVDDAVNMGLHFILQHLDKSGTYVRLLFVELSSAFNTIIPTLLQTKLTQLSVPSSICQWITSFLTDRHQLVKLGKFTSNSRTTSTGALQGCVLSPLLFSLYTNDCTSTDPSVKLLKFADDTTVIGLIQDGDESAYRQEIEQLAAWCSCNNLELNTLKTEEMIADFRRNTPAPS